MSIEKTINNFHSAIKDASKMLESYKKEINTKQETLYKNIYEIHMNEIVRGETKITELCNKQIETYNKTLSSWKDIVSKYIKNKDFVNKFEKSLLLIVFADVKAGKSSLGNFVSGYTYKETDYQKYYTKPEFYVYDYTEEKVESGKETKLEDGYFVEDEIQATASIQYFTLLDGLTWVDTPGIHSLTTEYEELAKQYVKFADLILFLTPSNNPFKQDEAEEIQKLLKSGKPMLIAITKSDSSVMSVVDGKIQKVLSAKNEKDRKAQEEHVKTEVERISTGDSELINNSKFISISTKLAKEAMKNKDDNKFEESNMPAFFEQIGAVISEKSLELKMKRPKDEMNLVIDELIEGNKKGGFIGIDDLIYELSVVLKNIELQKQKFSNMRAELLSSCKAETTNEIYTFLTKKKYENSLGKADIASGISEIVNKCINKNVKSALNIEFEDFHYSQEAHAKLSVISAEYKKNEMPFEYEMLQSRRVKRKPKGLLEHVEAFIFGKEFTEVKVKSKKFTKYIEIGDNFNDYAQEVWKEVEYKVEETIDVEIEKIIKEYCGVLEENITNMKNMLEKAKKEILSLKY